MVQGIVLMDSVLPRFAYFQKRLFVQTLPYAVSKFL